MTLNEYAKSKEKEMNETNPAMADCFSGTALKEIVNRLQNELLKEDEKLGTLITTEDGSNGVRVTKDGYVLVIDKSKYYPTIIKIIKLTNPVNYLENDIEALKKRIKHSKNPMEKKSYERQLNLAYKKRKQKKT